MWIPIALSILSALFGFVPAVTLAKETRMPVSVVIPAIGLVSSIEPVDLNEKDLVDVPDRTVGWYVRGVRPGEVGNAVLDGHVDTIFGRLGELKIGDSIEIRDIEGGSLIFRVVENELVKTEDFLVEKVYGTTDKKRLNIITCAGQFVPSKGTYSHRTVIYAEMVYSTDSGLQL